MTFFGIAFWKATAPLWKHPAFAILSASNDLTEESYA